MKKLPLILTGLALLLYPAAVSAHCDTLDGPTAKDGLLALHRKNLNYALKWITKDHEPELREAFRLALAVRELSTDAKTLADRFFLETLVRLHRAGEGASFEGLKPHGTPVEEKVVAADRAIAQGSLEPLQGLVPEAELPELQERLDLVLQRLNYDPDDLEAGRAYIEAYVHFFKFAEGEDHDHPKHHH